LAVKFHKVCVAGVGLIGGSMALAMKRLKLADEIVGVGRGAENLKEAVSLGIIDRYTHEMEEAVSGAELIVLATPVKAMAELVRKSRGRLKQGAIITEVGSTKVKMIREILPLLQERVEFVPAHPIAGKEKSGAKYSDPEIFRERWTIIVPSGKSSDAAILKVKELWLMLGAKVEVMSAEIHDRILAAVSHLPHVAAYALTGSLLEMDRQNPMLRFSAGGFKDFIRIAGSSPEMWRDICLENKGPIIDALDRYGRELEKLRRMISQEDAGALEKYFSECRRVKERVDKGNG